VACWLEWGNGFQLLAKSHDKKLAVLVFSKIYYIGYKGIYSTGVEAKASCN